jgi:hypothetical protein
MKSANETLKLKVTEALGKDVGRGYARMGPEDLEKLQLAIGDLVEVAGKRKTVCKAMPAYKELRGRSRIQLDGISRENAGAGIDDFVQVRKIACRPGERIVLNPITITPAEKANIPLYADLQPGAYLELRVSDTGLGMEQDVLERIFDPFFTTKEPGKGTGMGLAVVYGIIQDHGGAIRVTSKPGMGTTFQVSWPR